MSSRVLNWRTSELASPTSLNYMPQLPVGAPLRKDMRSGPTVGLPRHKPVRGVTMASPSSTHLLSLRGQLRKGLLPLAPVQLELMVSVAGRGLGSQAHAASRLPQDQPVFLCGAVLLCQVHHDNCTILAPPPGLLPRLISLLLDIQSI